MIKRFGIAKKSILVVVLFVCFGLFCFLNINRVYTSNVSDNTEETANAIFSWISKISLPNKLDFCGERVPLEIPEVRERAEREFYLLLQQPGQLCLYLKRSGKYFPIYEKLLAENKMPDDIKYLSVAESALYQSRSSKNALGLWQFMKGTANTYGLIVNKYVDERCNVEKSTAAALKYLKNSRESLGSWTLAAAGYNMGNAGVRRAMTRQNLSNYYDLFLNEETSRFVFRIIIIKELMKNSQRYGLNFNEKDLYSLGDVSTRKVNGAIQDLENWAVENKYLYKDIKLLNPWILTNELPNGNWELLVPNK